jgi:hypothetical protein
MMANSTRSRAHPPRTTPRRIARARRLRNRRRWGVAAAVSVVVGLLTLVASVLPPRFGATTPVDAPAAAGTGAAAVTKAEVPGAGPQAEPTPSASATSVLRLAGQVPAAGSGSFAFASGRGAAAGRSGILRRYRVAVEEGAGEDITAFAATVETALMDPDRGWTAGGGLRLQRVPNGSAHDFTVYLATPNTAVDMCAAGGVDIRIDGQPYTSCRAPGKVIINLERWRRSVNHFVDGEVPLAVYRDYVINHEVGHELGYGHERCPGNGRPAPVMMQQTLFLDGCEANSWPYLDGRRHSGPQL